MIHSEKVININGKDYIDITSEMTQTFKNIMNPSQTINNQYTSQLGAQSIV